MHVVACGIFLFSLRYRVATWEAFTLVKLCSLLGICCDIVGGFLPFSGFLVNDLLRFVPFHNPTVTMGFLYVAVRNCPRLCSDRCSESDAGCCSLVWKREPFTHQHSRHAGANVFDDCTCMLLFIPESDRGVDWSGILICAPAYMQHPLWAYHKHPRDHQIHMQVGHPSTVSHACGKSSLSMAVYHTCNGLRILDPVAGVLSSTVS